MIQKQKCQKEKTTSYSSIPLDKSPFQRIFRQQITNLSLIYNEDITKPSWKSYTRDIYAHILTFFKNLTHLSIVGSVMDRFVYYLIKLKIAFVYLMVVSNDGQH